MKPNPIAAAARLALTPDMSRLARQELGGMSQTSVSKASGVQAYIVKQWEAGRFRPPAAALEKLRAFYEAEGVDLAAITEHVEANANTGSAPASKQSEPAPMPAGFTANARPGFFLAPELTDTLVARLMERMGLNDDRIAELMAQSFERGFLGDPTDKTDTCVRELMGTLAESYLLFRFLQGRNIVAKTREHGRSEPQTIGDFLSQWAVQDPEAAALYAAASKDEAATVKPTRKALQAVEEV